jgi:hypothetical protein
MLSLDSGLRASQYFARALYSRPEVFRAEYRIREKEHA